MILGIGSDLIDIRRIEKSLERHGERFVARIFTEVEKARAENRAGRVASYAKRFAAKEACSKALGSGISEMSLPRWRKGSIKAGTCTRISLSRDMRRSMRSF